MVGSQPPFLLRFADLLKHLKHIVKTLASKNFPRYRGKTIPPKTPSLLKTWRKIRKKRSSRDIAQHPSIQKK